MSNSSSKVKCFIFKYFFTGDQWQKLQAINGSRFSTLRCQKLNSSWLSLIAEFWNLSAILFLLGCCMNSLALFNESLCFLLCMCTSPHALVSGRYSNRLPRCLTTFFYSSLCICASGHVVMLFHTFLFECSSYCLCRIDDCSAIFSSGNLRAWQCICQQYVSPQFFETFCCVTVPPLYFARRLQNLHKHWQQVFLFIYCYSKVFFICNFTKVLAA